MKKSTIKRDTRRAPVAVHPGVILKKEFLQPMGITEEQLAKHLKLPVQLIQAIVRGEYNISPEKAWLLGEALETTPQFWMNLQSNYELATRRPHRRVKSICKDNKTFNGKPMSHWKRVAHEMVVDELVRAAYRFDYRSSVPGKISHQRLLELAREEDPDEFEHVMERQERTWHKFMLYMNSLMESSAKRKQAK